MFAGGRLVTTNDRLDAAGFVVERVQDGEEAFAGNTEHAFDAMSEERIDD
jgi:hypothetical protein